MTFPVLPANGPSGYNLTNSLRFRSSATAYLNRTLASTSSTTTWTWSGWYKRGALATGNAFFSASDGGGGSGYWCQMVLNSSDKLNFIVFSGGVGSISGNKTTTAVYRDPSAWYHIVFVFNTTSATAEDRMQIWVNGVRVTAWDTNTLISQNFAGYINNSTYVHELGALYYTPNTNFVDGYMAEVNFIDGQALTPSSFGSTNAITGVWQPAKYTGTYGTNGFYLPFTNTTSTTTLGNDFSGNGNNWTTNNISLTPGVTYDAMTDVPTLTSPTAANYSTLNPLDVTYGTTTVNVLSNGNLTATETAAAQGLSASTIKFTSGKWYVEFTASTLSAVTSAQYVGFRDVNNAAAYYAANGTVGGVSGSSGGAWSAGDIIGVAVDKDNGTIEFFKNNTTQGGSRTITTNAAGNAYLQISNYNGGVVHANFGQRPFAYTPPSGFVALNTFNLLAGTITTSGTFTGNSSTDGPFVYLNGVPTAMTINGNAVTFGTHADKLANGFKVRSSTSSYNTSGSNTYSVTSTGAVFKNANAQGNP